MENAKLKLYFEEVLGVKQILVSSPISTAETAEKNTTKKWREKLTHPSKTRLLFFHLLQQESSVFDPSPLELLTRMSKAMNLNEDDWGLLEIDPQQVQTKGAGVAETTQAAETTRVTETTQSLLAQHLKSLGTPVVVALGSHSCQFLIDHLSASAHISEKKPLPVFSRGKWVSLGRLKLMPTHSPFSLLQKPQYKAHTWKDLQLVMMAV